MTTILQALNQHLQEQGHKTTLNISNDHITITPTTTPPTLLTPLTITIKNTTLKLLIWHHNHNINTLHYDLNDPESTTKLEKDIQTIQNNLTTHLSPNGSIDTKISFSGNAEIPAWGVIFG